MHVLITGGTGRVGRAVTERFVRHGWDVRVIGIEPEFEFARADYAVCDIMNYDALREQMQGCQAVVHLAAIASPTSALGHELFQINVAGAFNVFEAAAAEGIRRIVQASSINAFGCFWGNTDISPQYFPIDEEHPTFTTDPYSFSKGIVEEIGDYYWRREGISSVAIRLPGVWSKEGVKSKDFQQKLRETHKLLDEFAGQPEAERLARLAEVRKIALDYRRQRLLEFPAAQAGWITTGFSDDPLWLVYNFARFKFWAFVDERDSAQAMEKGVTADFEGSHALFVGAPHNSIGYNSETLVRLFFAEVSRRKKILSGSETLISIDKARALIGFEPEHSIP